MKVQHGDVILVNYPFASGSGSKVRLAVVDQLEAEGTGASAIRI